MSEIIVAPVKERPILFSAPMIRAVLAGTKTQTRRVMARQKKHDFTDYTLFGQQGHPDDEAARRGGWAEPWKAVEHAPDWPDGKEDQCLCPYARQRGDRLWVRESLERSAAGPWIYRADEEPVEMRRDDPRVSEMVAWAHHKQSDHCPSIHMPRWASRILLEVTEVSVERLQAISEEDALAEGIQAMRCPDCHLAAYGLPGWGHDELNPTAKGAYRYLWESINGAGTWDQNDWVWAVSFKRITP